MSKKVFVKRHEIDSVTWFQIIHNGPAPIFLDAEALLILQKSGVEINDVDAILAEMVRNN